MGGQTCDDRGGATILIWGKGKKRKRKKKGRKEGEDGADVSYNSLKFFNELVDEILRWFIVGQSISQWWCFFLTT